MDYNYITKIRTIFETTKYFTKKIIYIILKMKIINNNQVKKQLQNTLLRIGKTGLKVNMI